MAKKLNSLPIGTKVSIGASYYGEDVTFLLADKAKDNVLITERIITIKAFDAKEPSNSNSDRRGYGNNRYVLSNLLQWLNSNETKWYSPAHSADAPPSTGVSYNPYENEAGFLSNVPKDIADAILTTVHTVVKSSVDGGGSESHSSKVYLPSRTEVGLGNEGVAEGVKWELFTTSDSSRLAYPTAKAVANSNYTTSGLSSSKPWYYWLRTPHASSAGIVRSVDSDGSLYDGSAYGGDLGVRPALNLPSDILVSDAPNASGAYEVLTNSPPSLTLTSPANGLALVQGSVMSIKGSATDTDVGDAVTVKYRIDTTAARNIKAYVSDGKPSPFTKDLTFTNGALYDGSTLIVSLTDGNHTLEVWAEDGKGAKSTVSKRTFSTVKNRPPTIEVTQVPTIEGGINTEELTIKVKVTDPDGGELKVTSTLNGKESKTQTTTTGSTVDVKYSLSSLVQDDNVCDIKVTDNAGVTDAKKVKLTTNITKATAPQPTVRFDLLPSVDINGLVAWIKHTGKLGPDVHASIHKQGGDEKFGKMAMSEGESPTGVLETQYTYKSGTVGNAATLKIHDVDKVIMIMGGMSPNEI